MRRAVQLATVLSLLAAVVLTAGAAPAPAEAAPPAARCSTTGSPSFGLDLTGTWKFVTGDDPAWSAPAFDDTAWEDRAVPDDWNATAQASYDGYAWYRKTFTLPERPADLPDSAVIAALGFVDDADVTYLNGTQIGRTGGFPPQFDAEWDVPREYYPPTGALRWGATNVLAVRMYDGTGGGGFYKGPVGLYSKAALRTLSGLVTSPATDNQIATACSTLAAQRDALAAGDADAYLQTLSGDFLHSGDTKARREREVRGFLAAHGGVRLLDDQTEVVQDAQGRIIVDTIRSWSAADGTTLYAPTRQFLHLAPKSGLELGDRSRFFRDSYQSAAMAKTVNFNVYLPPSYTTTTARRFPVVFMLHGINGSNVEWEVRGMDDIVDSLIATKGIEEPIVVFPDGSSGWYVDSSAGNYRSMVVDELLPLVDREYRTIADRDHRGITGVSMGGFGSFSIGLEHPELFSAIASHIGALDLPPLAGTATEIAVNSKYIPVAMVDAMTPAQLLEHTYYFDAGDQDEFRFGEAARLMSAKLTAKLVPHEWQTGPGTHADSYWVPKLDRSFGLHTKQFRAHPFVQPPEPVVTTKPKG